MSITHNHFFSKAVSGNANAHNAGWHNTPMGKSRPITKRPQCHHPSHFWIRQKGHQPTSYTEQKQPSCKAKGNNNLGWSLPSCKLSKDTFFLFYHAVLLRRYTKKRVERLLARCLLELYIHTQKIKLLSYFLYILCKRGF